MRHWLSCPRCKWQSYEVLKSYAYCCTCNFSPELLEKHQQEVAIPKWVYDALAAIPFKKTAKKVAVIGGAV